MATIVADSAEITELSSGSFVCKGPARFLNGAYIQPTNGTNINQVASGTTVANTDYILVTDGNTLRRVSMSDFMTNVLSLVEAAEGVSF